jgi:hypothetical protein
MSNYPFLISSVPFYASTEDVWQPYGVLNSTTSDGRPNPAGAGGFKATVRAMAYDSTYQTGSGAPFETSGTYKQLFNIWKTSATSGYRLPYSILDPRTNTYITGTGVLQIDQLIAALVGGPNLEDVPIAVDYFFLDSDSIGTYYGGEPAPNTTTPPYIPGDPLPAPTGGLTYGWNEGRWNYGYYGRGEGV